MRKEFSLLLKEIPALVTTLFVMSVIMMNLLANKTILSTEYLALDGGILISWLSFLCMDIITMRFGPKASTKIAILAMLCNIFACIIFYIASIIPSSAGDYSAFDSIFHSTWFILLGSMIAFLASAIVNNTLNHLLGKLLNKDSKIDYTLRTSISTFIGQFIDNLLFAMIVFMLFAPIFWDGFSWTFFQCVGCAFTGAIFESLTELLFAPLGYKIYMKWKDEGVGERYLRYVGEKR